VATAGVISPAVSHDTRFLAIGMLSLMGSGLLCWIGYQRLARRRPGDATQPAPALED
jgi:threonine/homoserine/homoserine lactone efflux protein